MAQATLNPIKFLGRPLLKTGESGRTFLGEKVELDRDAVIEALKEVKLSAIHAVAEEEPGIFTLALDIWEETKYMPGFANHTPFVAFICNKDSLIGGANYRIYAIVEADGEIADDFQTMLESGIPASAKFNEKDGITTSF